MRTFPIISFVALFSLFSNTSNNNSYFYAVNTVNPKTFSNMVTMFLLKYPCLLRRLRLRRRRGASRIISSCPAFHLQTRNLMGNGKIKYSLCTTVTLKKKNHHDIWKEIRSSTVSLSGLVLCRHNHDVIGDINLLKLSRTTPHGTRRKISCKIEKCRSHPTHTTRSIFEHLGILQT